MKTSRFTTLYSLVMLPLVLGLVLCNFTAQAGEDNGGIIRRGEAGMAFFELGDLNNRLVDQGYARFSESMFLSGASAFYEVSPDVRLGGAGYRGSSSNSFDNGNGKLSFNFFGLLFESGISVTDSLRLMIGSVAGMGLVNLRITESIPGSFEEALTDTPNRHKLAKNFYCIQPVMSVEIGIFPKVALRANLGYLWGFGDRWNLDGKKFAGPLNQLKASIISVSAHFGGNGNGEEEGNDNGKEED